MNQSLQTSNSDSDAPVGMSDEEELRRWKESLENPGLGEELIESYGNEFAELGLIPTNEEL